MNHVTGLLDLVDLWVIKMKKPMSLCARSTSRIIKRARNADHDHTDDAARVYERSVYSIVKMTRIWLSNVLRNSRGAQRYMGFFVLFGCWLAGEENFGHVVFIRVSLARYIYSVEYGRVVDTKAGHDDASKWTHIYIYFSIRQALLVMGLINKVCWYAVYLLTKVQSLPSFLVYLLRPVKTSKTSP